MALILIPLLYYLAGLLIQNWIWSQPPNAIINDPDGIIIYFDLGKWIREKLKEWRA